MKTKFAIMVLALFAVQAVSAQFRLGIKGGTNISKVDGVPFDDQFRYSYHVGGFSEIVLTKNKKLSFQPEVLFSQYSSTLDSNFKSVYQDFFQSEQSKVKLNYLSFPLLLNYKLIGPIYLQAGPAFSILLDENKKFLQNGADAFKKGDFSMIGGAQIRIANVYVTGRYVVGLNNINDVGDQSKWRNQAVQLSLGLSL